MLRRAAVLVALVALLPVVLGYAASFRIKLEGASTEYRIPIEDVETIAQTGGPKAAANITESEPVASAPGADESIAEVLGPGVAEAQAPEAKEPAPKVKVAAGPAPRATATPASSPQGGVNVGGNVGVSKSSKK